MQGVSSDFHSAVLAGAPQSAYLRFEDDIFTNEDIDISGGGMRWNQAFCTDTDLRIGATMSAQLSCDILNENHVLRDYTFGEFEAWLGVRISNTDETTFAGLESEEISGNEKLVTKGTSPNWVVVDGTALSSQPTFEPVSMVVDRKTLYAIKNDGTVWGYDLEDGAVLTLSLTDHMEAKAVSFAKRGLFVACREGTDVAFTEMWTEKSGKRAVYEYCRLGIFNAERPAKLMDATVELSGYDRMTLFEKKLGSDLTIPTGGISFGNMLAAICTDIGVTLKTTTFPNSTLLYKKASSTFKSATFREIVGYIAEAAGRVARITRDGQLELVWLNSTQTRLTADKYSEATVYSYSVKSIGKTAIYKDSGGVTISE